MHWPPRSSVGVESVTSAVQYPIGISTMVLPVHRNRFRDALRSRGIDLHRPRRRWCHSHAEAEPDSDVRRDSVHPAIMVIDSDARTTTTIIVWSTQPTSPPDTDVHVSDPHWGRVAERHLLRALFGLLVECGVEPWVPEGLDHVFISYVSGWRAKELGSVRLVHGAARSRCTCRGRAVDSLFYAGAAVYCAKSERARCERCGPQNTRASSTVP